MLKKLIYIGLGISIIAVKKSVSYLLEKKDGVDEALDIDSQVDEAVVSQSAAVEAVAAPPQKSESVPEPDDLTEINGIGPTYAKRLKEAGIKSYAALAEISPEELHEISKATGKSADVDSWIAQAGSLA